MRVSLAVVLALAVVGVAACGTSEADKLAAAHQAYRTGCMDAAHKQGIQKSTADAQCACTERYLFAKLPRSDALAMESREPPAAVRAEVKRLLIAAVPGCVAPS
jgi:hypothetical protein